MQVLQCIVSRKLHAGLLKSVSSALKVKRFCHCGAYNNVCFGSCKVGSISPKHDKATDSVLEDMMDEIARVSFAADTNNLPTLNKAIV